MSTPVPRLGGHVRWIDFDEFIIVFDGREGRFSAVDPIWAASWRRLFGSHPSGGGLADDNEAQAFLEDIGRAGWIDRGPPSPPATGDRLVLWPPASAPAFAHYAAVSLRLRLFGFGPTYAAVERLRAGRMREGLSPSVEAVVGRYRRGEGPFVRRAFRDCLRRSLSLHALLKRCGIASRHHIGVALHPFRSHAWVEVDARPVLEAPRATSPYRTISAIG
ncbi:MAG TPA: lasso peptide biosynthesis B2 protein [Allosphingosinicella sp.]